MTHRPLPMLLDSIEPTNHYRAYATRGDTTVGSASINGKYEDAVNMARDLQERCPDAQVTVYQSGSARPIISPARRAT